MIDCLRLVDNDIYPSSLLAILQRAARAREESAEYGTG